LKIAVVGSGISGLGASLILSQKHEVHLFEADARLGGHAHTSTVKVGSDQVNVDTGFLVFNDLTYPHLRSMFKYLGVEIVNSDMSLSIRIPHANLEWAGDNLDTVFAQRKNLFNIPFQIMLKDILKFHKNAEKLRDEAREKNWTVADLLDNKKYSAQLREWYVLPMVAAIWSTPETDMLNFPADTFLTFFLNHKLLQVNDRPQWKTVKGGSKHYVEAIAKRLQHIHLNEPVVSVQAQGAKVLLKTVQGETVFDKVIFATQPELTRKILRIDNKQVDEVLSKFKIIQNKAYLHQDTSFMPKSKKCWSSWCVQANYNTDQQSHVALTYYLNRLQPLTTKQDVFLTLNPSHTPSSVIMTANYGHPQFDRAAIEAQKLVPQIQGIDNIYYAGAWTRYGFHEDGLLSAVNVSELLGVKHPWVIEPL
jgi:uncharacterized protein